MINLDNLKEIFFRDKRKCSHSYPKKMALADALDREGNFMRIYFCIECKDYRWQEVGREKWDGEFLSRLKEDKYYVHSTFGDVVAYEKSFKGVFGKGKWWNP